MNNRLVKLLLALVLVATLLPVTPAFAVSTSRSQALAYKKHSLGLNGVSNARDLGGYQTKDGRTIKFGKLFRTGELTDMTAADKKKLVKKYHLVKDIDFRSARNILTDGEDPELPGVERRWIEESYKTIETYYGSVNSFLKKKIGLSSNDIKKLRNAYLTPAK